MIHATLRFKQIVLLLCLWCANGAHAQLITNGGFDQSTPSLPYSCGAPAGWTCDPAPPNDNFEIVRWDNQSNNLNWWVDLKGCNGGYNGHWIEQQVATTPGKTYKLKFDLGCLNGLGYQDAGVFLYINSYPRSGPQNGRFAHATFTGSPLAWKTFEDCFVASSSLTTIRFAGVGFPTASTPPGSPLSNYGAVGIDNVIMTEIVPDIQKGTCRLTYDFTACTYCFKLEDSLVTGARPRNVKWFVDGVWADANFTDSSYCRMFATIPQALSHEIMVVYEVAGKCGNDTVKLIVNPLPSVVRASDVVIDLTCGEDSAYYTPDGCSAPYNGYNFFKLVGPYRLHLKSGALPLTGILPGMDTGEYEFICNYEDPVNPSCTTRHITKIIVNPAPAWTESTCTVVLANCFPPFEEEDFVFKRIVDRCPDCADIVRSASVCSESSWSGPWSEVYDGKLTLTRTYFDYANCRKCTVIFVIERIENECKVALSHCSQLEDPDFINRELNECPECQQTVGSATSVGELQIGNYNVNSGTQTLIREYMDEAHCSRCKVAFQVPMRETSCTVSVDDCRWLEDEDFVTRTEILSNCPDCKQTVSKATLKGPWKQLGYAFGGTVRRISREYINLDNCTKCTVTFLIPGEEPEPYIIHTDGRNCVTICAKDLPGCFPRTGNVTVFPLGFPVEAVSMDLADGIRLCRRPSVKDVEDPVFYLYSKDAPCCFILIKLTGDAPPANKPLRQESTPGITSEAQEASAFRLVPNPATTTFRIVSDKACEQYQKVEIVDLDGKTIWSRQKVDAGMMIDMAAYGPGMYIVKITTPEGVISALRLVLLKN